MSSCRAPSWLLQVHALVAAGWLGPLFGPSGPAAHFLDAADAPSLPQGWLNTLQYVWTKSQRARAWCATRAALHEALHDALRLAAPPARHAAPGGDEAPAAAGGMGMEVYAGSSGSSSSSSAGAGGARWQVVGPAELRLPPEWGSFSVPLPPTATVAGRAMALLLPEEGSYAYACLPHTRAPARGAAHVESEDKGEGEGEGGSDPPAASPAHAPPAAAGPDTESGMVAHAEVVLLGDALWYQRLLHTLGWVVVVVDPRRWDAPQRAPQEGEGGSQRAALSVGQQRPRPEEPESSSHGDGTGWRGRGIKGRPVAQPAARTQGPKPAAPATAAAAATVTVTDAPAEHMLLAGRAAYLRQLLLQHSGA